MVMFFIPLQVALRGGKVNLKVFSEKQILKNNADLLSLQQIPPMVDL